MPRSQSESLREALVRAAEALGDALERDAELRSALGGLALAWAKSFADEGEGQGREDVWEETGEEALPQPEPAGGGMGGGHGDVAGDAAPRPSQEQLEELVAVLSGESAPPAPEADSALEASLPRFEAGRGFPETDQPSIVAERCRLKAKACELEIRYQESRDSQAEAEARREIAQLISQARGLPNCFLWILRTEARHWISIESLELLARSFENLAEAMSLAAETFGDREPERSEMERVLALAAEAQRALREAVIPFVGPGRVFEDADQLAAFRWIADRCETLGIYVARYMRIDDVADPGRWRQLRERLRAFREERSDRLAGARALNRLWGRLRYECLRLGQDPEEEPEERAAKIAETVQALVESGVPPSDTRLRGLLLPVFGTLLDAPDPQGDLDGYRLALRETDRYLSQRESAAGCEEDEARDPETEEVRQVREWLRGKALVIIGGEQREAAARRLKGAFELEELVWVATRPHESNELFEAPVSRENVAAVLLAIRWSSHSYAGVKSLCDEAGKPLVRLPGGYGVNRVAAEIVAQASGVWEGA